MSRRPQVHKKNDHIIQLNWYEKQQQLFYFFEPGNRWPSETFCLIVSLPRKNAPITRVFCCRPLKTIDPSTSCPHRHRIVYNDQLSSGQPCYRHCWTEGKWHHTGVTFYRVDITLLHITSHAASRARARTLIQSSAEYQLALSSLNTPPSHPHNDLRGSGSHTSGSLTD